MARRLRVLHTADWHLGHTLREDPRDFEHACFLEWLLETLEAREVDALLVAGSSLMVYSGYRFAEYAHRHGKPVMAINLGKTRADHLLAAKVECDCGEFLSGLGLMS